MAAKYLLKIGTQLRIVPSKKLTCLSFHEAMAIVLASSEEQKRQLVQDALNGDRYYYGHKVVDSLELTLNKLEEMFPSIRQQIKMLTTGINSVN